MRNLQTLGLLFAIFIGMSACTPLPDMGEDSVTLIIRFEASEEGLEVLSGILNGVSDAMQTEAGFVSANVHRNIQEPNVFVLAEVWQTQALHEEHFDRINASGDWDHIKSLLVAEPQMGYFRPL
ncbi:putative quinol monooxygenase [Erythrobacter sp. HA6-11]